MITPLFRAGAAFFISPRRFCGVSFQGAKRDAGSLRPAWWFALFLASVAHLGGSEAGWRPIEKDVWASMRDGVRLQADVYRPDQPGVYPVLVVRTPYGRKAARVVEPYVKAGYIVVSQDVRGRYASEGEFLSFVHAKTHDAEDGYDTVEWAARLPGSSGKVGTFGVSYDAFLQWRLAALRPPSLVAMAASSIPARMTDLEGPGTIRPGRRLKWYHGTIAPNLRQRAGGAGPYSKKEANEIWDQGERHFLWFTPWLELPDAFWGSRREAEGVRAWLKDPAHDPWRFDAAASQITVPNLAHVGWYDHCNGSLDIHDAIVARGGTELARGHQHIVIGPWPHGGYAKRKIGSIDFGPESAVNLADAQIRWFNHWLKGEDNGVRADAPVRLFTMGVNRWRDEREWPLRRAVRQDLFLASGGRAATPAGDGRLDPAPPASTGKDLYTYDPRNPVPSLWTAELQTIPAEQSPLRHRADILVYQTEPLREAIEVTGYPELELFAASSAPDTDFFARLIDVAPDGTAIDVAAGMVRARYRESVSTPRMLEPGKPTRFRIRLGPTSIAFQAGHRIRLDVTSSDFPNYDRNHNTAADPNADPSLRPAEQTVFHGSELASRLILPVIPPSAADAILPVTATSSKSPPDHPAGR
jgi:putative CocE/NonD family hydrolase